MSAELRREALARAESMRTPHVAEVLRRSQIEARERAANAWESSDGTVRAIDVRVLVDGHALALVTTRPSVHDAVVEAITAVAPRVLDASVVDLSFAWGIAEESADASYREPPAARVDRRSARDVKRALAGFLAAIGEHETAREVERGELEVPSPRTVLVSLEPERVEAAIAALLGRRVRVRRIDHG